MKDYFRGETADRLFKELGVEERKTGKWLPIIDADEYGEPYQSGVYCSECGEMLCYVPQFCPNCGARMTE